MTGHRWRVVAALLALVIVGGAIAAGLTAYLGIRTASKTVPAEHPVVAPVSATALPPRFTAITAASDPRTTTAVAELRDAVDDAARTRGTATLTVRAGHGEDDDTYRLSGTPGALVVTATSTTGAVRGIYDLASAIRDGRPVTERLGETVTSRLPFRMADLGAAGVVPEPAAWRAGDDYSHTSNAFRDVILPRAPYVDRAALKVAAASADRYFRHLVAEGYNAVAVPGLLEYLTFSEVADGEEVYAGDAHVARAEAMRAAFGPIWKRAHDLGLAVYLRTDMLALSTPLERYLERRFGLDTEDPGLWQVYAAGLDELYREMPYLSGTVIRIGEAGRIYDLPGWDYYSSLAVRSVKAVRAMLTAFVDEAERADREIVFRTWSVGVGAVGDMHTNPASYEKVLGGIDSDHLIVSTKYTLGDFYSYLPFNETLEIGRQRRIVELQSRREFEDLGGIPNDLGDLYRQALRHFLAQNPAVEGIWTWTQDGGPWRAGPMTLELTAGFWQLYELNTVLAVRLARDPDTDPAAVTAGWARRWLSDDPATVRAIGEAMARSRDAVTSGLYIGPYAEQRVFALGLEPPPMMWIFEWDILTGDSATLDLIYATSRPDVEAAIGQGAHAVEVAEQMRDRIAATDPATWKDPELHRELVGTLDYQVDLFGMLGTYRTMFLRHAEWLDTGSGEARRQWAQARRAFDRAADAHERRYAGDLAHPAYNLTAARIGETHAARDLPMAWLARGGLALLLLWLGLGITGRVRAARATWLAGTRPWRAAEAVEGLGGAGRALALGVPMLALVGSRAVLTWFAAPAHLVLVGIGWLALAAVVLLAVRRRDPWPVIAAIGGAVVLRVVVLLIALAPHGPGGYWFAFWTEPRLRSAYVVMAFASFGWVLAAAGWSLAASIGRRRAVGAVLAVIGLALLAGGLLIGLVGAEEAMTAWNDQLALLPWGLSRILGITLYLGIPAATPWWAAGLGAVLLLAGLAAGLQRQLPRLRDQRAG